MSTEEPREMLAYETCLFPVLAGGRLDEVLRVAIPVVAEHGWLGVTPRSLAEPLRCTRQCVHQWFGSQDQLRHRFAERLCHRYGDWACARLAAYGPVGLLPESSMVATWVACWWAMREASHRDRLLAELVAVERDRELRTLRRLRPEATEPELDVVLTAAEGFQARLCRADEVGTELLDHARRCLDRGGLGLTAPPA